MSIGMVDSKDQLIAGLIALIPHKVAVLILLSIFNFFNTSWLHNGSIPVISKLTWYELDGQGKIIQGGRDLRPASSSIYFHLDSCLWCEVMESEGRLKGKRILKMQES